MNFKLKLIPVCAINVVNVFLILNSNIFAFNVNASVQNFTHIYRDYLRNMINIMDYEVQPCINFFYHACGNFERFQKGDLAKDDGSEEEQDGGDIAPFLYNKQDYYKFFTENKQDFKTSPGVMLRNVYDMCKNFEKQKLGKRKIWLKMLHDIEFLKHDHDILRKWPFLEYQWNKYERQLDLNWPTLAAEFSAHGVNIFFNVFFAEKTMYVAPNDDLECLEFDDYRKSLLPLIGKRNMQIADIIGRELWLLCRQLKGEIAISEEEEVDAMPNLLMDQTIREFFQSFLTRLNFTDSEIENTHEVMIHIDKLSNTMTLLRLTNPRIIYNFILWQAYQQISNINDCFSLTYEFDTLLQVEYWHWFAFNPYLSRGVAMASYLFHATRFQKHYKQFITSTSWERLFQNRSERKDLNIERSIRNYAKQYLDLENYSLIYNSEVFSNEKPTFYSNLLELRRLRLRYSFLNPYEEDTEDLHFFKEFINFCILLQYRPRLHYFASYDREMWQNSKLLQNSDGYYSAVDCLSHQTAMNDDIYENLSMEQISDVFNFYTAFNEALADYKFWLESENFAIAEDFILEYFKINSLRVVFYAVAQLYCGRNDAVYSSLINRSYMNMPEFQDAFKCMSNDEMNPTTKCMINHCL